MNKLFIVIIITSMVVFSALAGGKGIVKPISGSQCLNFKAVAKVQCTGLYHIVGESRNCCDDPAKASASKSMNGKLAAYEDVTFGCQGFFESGAVYRTTWCSRGEPLAEYFYYNEEDTLDLHEESQISVDSIVFDYATNTITLHNIRGYFKNESSDFQSTFLVQVWRPESIEDDQITFEKVVYEASATLLNGNLTLNNFDNSNIYMQDTIGIPSTMILDGFNYSINLNEDLLNLAVAISTDGQPNAHNAMRTAVKKSALTTKSNKVSDFELFPNPANMELKVKFKNEFVDQTSSVKLYIFDDLGNLKMAKENVLFENQVLMLDVAALNKGVYFLQISNGKEKIIKNFTIL
jgi:hypothetical protein